MTTLKLEVLVKAGLYKVGDVWSFSKTVGRGKKGVVVEKDVSVIAIDNGRLTFAIPPGQSKYLVKDELEKDIKTNSLEKPSHPSETIEVPVDKLDDLADKVNLDAGIPESVKKVNGSKISGLGTDQDLDQGEKGNPMDLDVDKITREGKDATSGDVQFCCNDNNADKHIESTEPIISYTVEEPPEPTLPPRRRVTRSQNNIHRSRPTEKAAKDPKPASAPKRTNGQSNPKTPMNLDDPNEPITITITTPSALESKILEVDGRIQSSGKSNAWKVIRCKRDNQDMGSLWEMREEYYVRRLSQ
ncbi:MAG: hypothetical protein Q9187_006677 [Circinaria calcarea]